MGGLLLRSSPSKALHAGSRTRSILVLKLLLPSTLRAQQKLLAACVASSQRRRWRRSAASGSAAGVLAAATALAARKACSHQGWLQLGVAARSRPVGRVRATMRTSRPIAQFLLQPAICPQPPKPRSYQLPSIPAIPGAFEIHSSSIPSF